MPTDTTYHDEETLEKVRNAMTGSVVGLSLEGAQALISDMQNAGILFRERDPWATAGVQEPQEAAERENTVTVECKVRVPFSSASAAVGVLSRIPIDATITYNQGTGDGIGRWTEER